MKLYDIVCPYCKNIQKTGREFVAAELVKCETGCGQPFILQTTREITPHYRRVEGCTDFDSAEVARKKSVAASRLIRRPLLADEKDMIDD